MKNQYGRTIRNKYIVKTQRYSKNYGAGEFAEKTFPKLQTAIDEALRRSKVKSVVKAMVLDRTTGKIIYTAAAPKIKY